MIDIEINGIALKAPLGASIIEVADANGISIPRFCYHKKLSIAANCRMCLVEVDKVGKPLPACATPVTANMKVFTQSPKARDAQRAVMEFLLINHPLDCPICDQGGQCELQDNAMTYGQDFSRFDESKRVVVDKDIGPLIATDLTRCIQCTRCVRFGQEIAGLRELGALGRGEKMSIGTFVEQSLVSEISGNIIDLCPVGALTSKPFRFKARPWELNQHASISPHDCLGTNLYIHTRNGDVMRVVPRDNEAINETWLADRDRYSYTALKSPDRLTQPCIKRNGQWQVTDWTTALATAADNLMAINAQHGSDALAMLASPISTSEEFALFAKIAKHLKVTQFDHRIKTQDQRDQTILGHYLSTDTTIVALEDCQVALIVGSHLAQELPLALTRIRKASLQGAVIHALNPAHYEFNCTLSSNVTCAYEQLVTELASIVKAVLLQRPDRGYDALISSLQLKELTPSAAHLKIAEDLLNPSNERKIILLGQLADHHPDAALLRALCLTLNTVANVRYFFITDGANSTGGAIAQHLQNNISKPYATWVNNAVHAYVLLNLEPDVDCAHSGALVKQLKQAECVIAISAFDSAQLRESATILLPAACFTETSGSFANIEGFQQCFAASVAAPGDSRPGWKILRVLGNLLKIAGFDYVSSDDIAQELQAELAQKPLTAAVATIEPLTALLSLNKKCPTESLTLFSDWAIYRGDNIVRRAMPLQQALSQQACGIYMNSATAKQWPTALTLSTIDDRIADHNAFIPAGFAHSTELQQQLFQSLTIKPTHD